MQLNAAYFTVPNLEQTHTSLVVNRNKNCAQIAALVLYAAAFPAIITG